MRTKYEFTDYDIRIWGGTTFIRNRKNFDYVVDNDIESIGIQHCNLDNNQEKKAIELADKVVEAIRNLDEYLKEKSR